LTIKLELNGKSVFAKELFQDVKVNSRVTPNAYDMYKDSGNLSSVFKSMAASINTFVGRAKSDNKTIHIYSCCDSQDSAVKFYFDVVMFTLEGEFVKDLILYYTTPASEENFFYEYFEYYEGINGKEYKLKFEPLPDPAPTYKFGPSNSFSAINNTVDEMIRHINANITTTEKGPSDSDKAKMEGTI
jgi:hypothetical protein